MDQLAREYWLIRQIMGQKWFAKVDTCCHLVVAKGYDRHALMSNGCPIYSRIDHRHKHEHDDDMTFTVYSPVNCLLDISEVS